MTNLTVVLSSTAADDGPFALKSRWQFNAKRGAILLMYRPRLICVPDVFFEENSDLPLFKRKVVVDQVYECPGFFMYLSNKGGLCPILRVLHSFVDRFECLPANPPSS